MEITKELRATLLAEVKEVSRNHKKYGKPCVPLKERERIAAQYGVSTATITTLVTEAGLTWQRQWTDNDRKYIWCNYESLGAKVLAIMYHVTPRAIIQMVHDMRKAECKQPNPWQKV